MTRLTSLPARWLTAAVMCLCFEVQADELSEIHRLYNTGQGTTAMSRVNQALVDHPDDPHLRFMKGVMLAAEKRRAEAIALFHKLTEDFPDLAEPFNNLAVLYAADGDFAQARAALDQALRANPNYAVAHENLGDVYAALASQAYARALQLGPKNVTIPQKLKLMRELSAPEISSGNAATPTSTPLTDPALATTPLTTPGSK